MKVIRKILRLHYEAQLSLREIAACTSTSLGAVSQYIRRFEETDIVWPLSDDMTDIQLNAILFPPTQKDKYHANVIPNKLLFFFIIDMVIMLNS